MVTELRNLGAILYCKTYVPHTLMAGETVNNIIGYTSNPKNRELTCGGSSGGEGALVALKGSPIGLAQISEGQFESRQHLMVFMGFGHHQAGCHMKVWLTVWTAEHSPVGRRSPCCLC